MAEEVLGCPLEEAMVSSSSFRAVRPATVAARRLKRQAGLSRIAGALGMGLEGTSLEKEKATRQQQITNNETTDVRFPPFYLFILVLVQHTRPLLGWMAKIYTHP